MRDSLILWCSGCKHYSVGRTLHPTGLNPIYCDITGIKTKITVSTICQYPQGVKAV